VLGILGGMGPLATVDFLKKLILETKSDLDQRHIPTVIWSVPQIPDRSNHIINGGENPFPELRRGLLNLQLMGASTIAIPCNTAHFWYDALTENTGMKILHIVDAVIDQLYLANLKTSVKNVGILATRGTIRSEIYQKKLIESGYSVCLPTEIEQNEVANGIGHAKSGNLLEARKIFLKQIEQLRMRGADIVVLACTEIPAVLENFEGLIDSNHALAKRCVLWFDSTYNGIYVDQRSIFTAKIQHLTN
jgi:aspartate racemase